MNTTDTATLGQELDFFLTAYDPSDLPGGSLVDDLRVSLNVWADDGPDLGKAVDVS